MKKNTPLIDLFVYDFGRDYEIVENSINMITIKTDYIHKKEVERFLRFIENKNTTFAIFYCESFKTMFVNFIRLSN